MKTDTIWDCNNIKMNTSNYDRKYNLFGFISELSGLKPCFNPSSLLYKVERGLLFVATAGSAWKAAAGVQRDAAV